MNEIVLTVLNFDIGNSSLAITRKRQQLPFGLAITKERQLLKESSNCKTYNSSLPITRKRQPFVLAITKERQLLIKESSNCKTYHVLVKSRSKILII